MDSSWDPDWDSIVPMRLTQDARPRLRLRGRTKSEPLKFLNEKPIVKLRREYSIYSDRDYDPHRLSQSGNSCRNL